MGAKAMSSHGSGAGALSRQGSVCSLTFGEVDDGQLHGVHLDDLLRAATAVGGGGKRTADEVWRDIQSGCPRAQTMTLEDFLCRAASDAGERGGWAQPQQPAHEPRLGPHHQHQHHHHAAVGRPVPRPLGVGAGPVLDALYHDGHEAGLKRAAAADGGPGERTNERRKKRMIKNRESAARSRARKQAYTNELENKIAELEEENKRLRRHKVLEPVVQYVPQLEQKNQLRRTNSAKF